jgi:hypothetical protein
MIVPWGTTASVWCQRPFFHVARLQPLLDQLPGEKGPLVSSTCYARPRRMLLLHLYPEPASCARLGTLRGVYWVNSIRQFASGFRRFHHHTAVFTSIDPPRRDKPLEQQTPIPEAADLWRINPSASRCSPLLPCSLVLRQQHLTNASSVHWLLSFLFVWGRRRLRYSSADLLVCGHRWDNCGYVRGRYKNSSEKDQMSLGFTT